MPAIGGCSRTRRSGKEACVGEQPRPNRFGFYRLPEKIASRRRNRVLASLLFAASIADLVMGHLTSLLGVLIAVVVWFAPSHSPLQSRRRS
jgi:hypothetical protein